MIESFHFFEQISSRVLRLLRKKNSNKLSDKVQDYSMKSGIVPWTFPQLFFSIPWENAPTRPWKTYSWTPRVKENFFSKANWIGNRVDDGNEFIGDYQWLRRREFLSLRRSRDKKNGVIIVKRKFSRNEVDWKKNLKTLRCPSELSRRQINYNLL